MKGTVIFSNIKKELIANLSSANSEIKVAVAWLTDEDIIRTLTQKSKSGIDVQVVISNSKENFKNTSKLTDFLKNKGKLYIAKDKFLHNKFCIIDNSTIINGSYNWTYYAQRNEENIMVISLDKENNNEDNELLKRFLAKHKYFCNKLSIGVEDHSLLTQLKNEAKEISIILAQIDEKEIKLRKDLEEDVIASIDEAHQLNIPISNLIRERMYQDGGGVEFIKRLLLDEIATGEMKSGFKKLEEHIPPRIDLSFEYLVSRQKYKELFTAEEVQFCEQLIKKYNL